MDVPPRRARGGQACLQRGFFQNVRGPEILSFRSILGSIATRPGSLPPHHETREFLTGGLLQARASAGVLAWNCRRCGKCLGNDWSSPKQAGKHEECGFGWKNRQERLINRQNGTGPEHLCLGGRRKAFKWCLDRTSHAPILKRRSNRTGAIRVEPDRGRLLSVMISVLWFAWQPWPRATSGSKHGGFVDGGREPPEIIAARDLDTSKARCESASTSGYRIIQIRIGATVSPSGRGPLRRVWNAMEHRFSRQRNLPIPTP